jgi:hypothetical protein
MRGRLISYVAAIVSGLVAVGLVALVGWPASARAEQVAEATALASEPGADIELGGHMGVTTGGGATAGGMRFGGVLLYRLSRLDWFEGVLDFTVGAGSAACFRDRAGEFLCNHGSVSGRSLEIGGGVRRFLLPEEQFTPYAHVRVGARILSFPGDEVQGFAIPVVAGAGVRAQVSEFVTVGGGADLELGLGWFNHDLGVQPQVGLTVRVGAEFQLR